MFLLYHRITDLIAYTMESKVKISKIMHENTKKESCAAFWWSMCWKNASTYWNRRSQVRIIAAAVMWESWDIIAVLKLFLFGVSDMGFRIVPAHLNWTKGIHCWHIVTGILLQTEWVVYVPLSRLYGIRLFPWRIIICPTHTFHEIGFWLCLLRRH